MIVSQYLTILPEQVLDISLNTLRSLHDNLLTAVFIVGCNSIDDNNHQMVYPILQFFDPLTDDRYILTIIYCKPSCNLSYAESYKPRIVQ